MHAPGETSDHRLAAGATLALLAAAIAALLQQDPATPGRVPAPALQVTWIERVPPRMPPSPSLRPPRPSTPPRAATAGDPATPRARARDAAPPQAPAPARALQAVDLAAEARRWARAQGGVDFAPRPFEPRPSLDVAPQANLRMRAPSSPAAVLRSIGELVGGPGYEADPCPRVHRNLAALAGGDHALRDEEVRRLHALCR